MQGNKVKVTTWKVRVKCGGPALKGSFGVSRSFCEANWQMAVKSESWRMEEQEGLKRPVYEASLSKMDT